MKMGAAEPIAALNRIRIEECGEPLADIRVHCPHVEIPPKICPYLRESVARMLNQARAALPPAYGFRLGTALRTLSMQKRGWDAYFQRMKEERPDWPLSALRRATNRYHAPYDQPAPPGHCTGGAVDVILLAPDGEPADVTSPTMGWQAAYTWSDRISERARANRMLLVEAMLGAGFSNCREEYWHYSYGDSAWAVRVGKTSCPYGWIDPPVAVEMASDRGAAAISRDEEGVWEIAPSRDASGEVKLDVALLWSCGKPINVRFRPPIPHGIYASPDRDSWRPWEELGSIRSIDQSAESMLVSLTPETDRVYLASPVPDPSDPAVT